MMKKKRAARKWREREKRSEGWVIDVAFIPFLLPGDRFAIAFCWYFHRRRSHDATICSRYTRGQRRATQFCIKSLVFAHVCHDCELPHRGTPACTLQAIWLARFLNRQSKVVSALTRGQSRFSSGDEYQNILVWIMNIDSGVPLSNRKWSVTFIDLEKVPKKLFSFCT